MQVRMEVLRGAKTKEIMLRLPTVIGRGGDSKVKLPASTVSRHHCEIYEHEGQIVVRDLNSSNGTVVNGHKIKGPTYLTPDDELTIGPITAKLYEISEQAEAPLLAPLQSVQPAEEVAPDFAELPAEEQIPIEALKASSNVVVTTDVDDDEPELPLEPELDLEEQALEEQALEEKALEEHDLKEQPELTLEGPSSEEDLQSEPDLKLNPKPTQAAVSADEPSVVQSQAESVAEEKTEAESTEEDESVLQYAEPAESGRSFVGITPADEMPEAVSDTPVFDGAEEFEKPDVNPDDTALNQFFKKLDG